MSRVKSLLYISNIIKRATNMIQVSNLVKVIKSKNAEALNALIQDRTKVNQSMLDFLYVVGIEGIEITKDDMGLATWYYIWYKDNVKGDHAWDHVNLGSQFFWNEGEYDAQGDHSLYDEYGMELVK